MITYTWPYGVPKKNQSIHGRQLSCLASLVFQVCASAKHTDHAFPIACILDRSCPLPDIKASYPIAGDTGSDQALAHERSWLENCAKEHHFCPDEDNNTQMPTRVFKIDGPKQVKLHASVSGEVVPYLCISHCWGKSSMIWTTLSNLEYHQACIV
jgi:hypothetical protein